jgi:hypothetical protein
LKQNFTDDFGRLYSQKIRQKLQLPMSPCDNHC